MHGASTAGSGATGSSCRGSGSGCPAPRAATLNPLSTVSRWKIFDNLRRSLVEPTQLALLIACWALAPGTAAVWTGVVLFAIAWPWLLGLVIAVLRPPRDKSWRGYYASVGRDAITSAQQVALTFAFLPHQAAIAVDAIVRTIYRVVISRSHLLEWLSASQVERREAGVSRSTWRRMASALVIAIAVLALAAWRGALLPALPLEVLWLASPAIAQLLLRRPTQRDIRLTPAERAAAVRLALLHWRFFETFVSDATQGLAPDNFQESPEPVVAGRTSPTNIGLQLLSIVTARDLGFIGTGDMIERLEQVFRALERMRRYRGHFFNWYDLSDLRVLEPAYISTVDSGNLAGHLMALKQACLASSAAAPPTRAAVIDTVRAAIHLALGPPVTAAEPHLEAALAELDAPDARSAELPVLLGRLRPHLAAAADADADDGWWTRWLRDAAEARLGESSTADTDAAGHTARLAVLARRAHEYATGMDFAMLFDEQRKLFSIGYQEVGAALDSSFYDLLASEARLASYFAIAKDDVAPEHWFRLGRNLTVEGGATALVSWSGSMFEYLMPLLVMRSLPSRCSTRRTTAPCAARFPTGASTACPGARPSRPTTCGTATAPTSTARSASPTWGSSAGWPRSW